MKITIHQKGQESLTLDLDEISQMKSEEATLIGSAQRATAVVGSAGAVGLMNTMFNRIVSLGTYAKVKDLLVGISNKVDSAYKNKNAPSVEEAKQFIADAKGRMKSGFWGWMYGFNAGDKVKDIPITNITVREINGKPVAIAKMRFLRNTVDVSGLVNQMLVLINGFTKSGNKIDTFKIGKAYIKGKDKNLSTAESWTMYIDENGNGSDFYKDFDEE